MAEGTHVEVLLKGVDYWNAWRQEKPHLIPDLRGIKLDERNLRFIDFSSSNLRGASFRGANLVGLKWRCTDATGINLSHANLKIADFSGATLAKAALSGALLDGAKLSESQAAHCQMRGSILRRTNCFAADLTSANLADAKIHQCSFRNANLRGAILSRASLVEVGLEGTDLTGSHVYGVAAWDVMTDAETRMRDLVVSKIDDQVVTVDDLKVAQLVHLMLSSATLRRIVDTMTTKMVLVLGSFAAPRKWILEAVRDELRSRAYVPVIFDFANIYSRTLTETVRCLAHLSRFIIADITSARSIPQELMAVVPYLPSVPVQPLLLDGEDEWGMFESFRPYNWVLPLRRYRDKDELVGNLHQFIVDGPEQWLSNRPLA